MAVAAGLGRDWVIQFEKGKSSVELGLVLRVLEILELPLSLESERESKEGGVTAREEEVVVSDEPSYRLPTNLL